MAVEFTVEDGIAVITIARPEARNAIDRETALGVAEAIKRIESEDAVRVAVLTGAGGTFCAGMDLKAFLRGEVVRKRVLNESIDWQSGELFERQYEITDAVFASADAREGATAFAEKRKPVWRGV